MVVTRCVWSGHGRMYMKSTPRPVVSVAVFHDDDRQLDDYEMDEDQHVDEGRHGVENVRRARGDVIAEAVALVRLDDVEFFFSSRRRHTRCSRDWSSDVCSSD